MATLSQAFNEFLRETSGSDQPLDRAEVIRLLVKCLDDHQPLDLFPDIGGTKARPPGQSFCDTFEPENVNPIFIQIFADHFLAKALNGDEPALQAGRATIAALMDWLEIKGYWSDCKVSFLRNPRIMALSREFSVRVEFLEKVSQYVCEHPVEVPNKPASDDYHIGSFVVCGVEPGKLYLGYVGYLGPWGHASVEVDVGDGSGSRTGIMLELPSTITQLAKPGFKLDLEIARVQGQWRILDADNIYWREDKGANHGF